MRCEHVIRSFQKDSKICILLLQKWEVIKEIVNVLKVPYQATIVLQMEDFRLSDFYATWIHMNTKLQKQANKKTITDLANILLDKLKGRQTKLLDNPTMSAAIAIDPRFCSQLNNQQKYTAIKTLEDLFKRTKNVKGEIIVSSDSESDDDDISIKKSTILSKYRDVNAQKVKDVSIEQSIESFIAEKHNLTDGTILDFWKSKKVSYPALYELAMVILSVTPTQVIVERSFSVLSYVFNCLRNRLSEDMLEDILMIALNVDLFHEVNQEDLNKIFDN